MAEQFSFGKEGWQYKLLWPSFVPEENRTVILTLFTHESQLDMLSALLATVLCFSACFSCPPSSPQFLLLVSGARQLPRYIYAEETDGREDEIWICSACAATQSEPFQGSFLLIIWIFDELPSLLRFNDQGSVVQRCWTRCHMSG